MNPDRALTRPQAQTGVTVAQNVITEFNEFKLRSKFRYMVFKMNDTNSEVVIDKSGAPGASYQEFLDAFPAADCRYAVYNIEYKTEADGDRAKMVFFLWCVPCPPRPLWPHSVPLPLICRSMLSPFLKFVLIVFSRAPDSAKVKAKMLYAGTKDTLKKSLQGLQVEVQGTDKAEVSFDAVVEKCKSMK